MNPGQRRALQALQGALDATADNAWSPQPAKVTAVDGAAVTVTWNTTAMRVSYPDGMTFAVGDAVVLMCPPMSGGGGTPFIGWRLVGTPL